jgi:hypothetical protein
MSAVVLSTMAVYAADDIVMDPDGMTPFAEDSSGPTRNLGNVCLNTPAGGQVLLAASNGGGQTWNNSATVTVASGGATGSDASDVTVDVGSDSTIVLPSNWNTLAAGDLSSDTAVGTFSVTSAATGLHDANAKWTGTGAGNAGTQDTPNLHLVWNVVECTQNQLPIVGAGGPYSGGEGSAIALSGTATDDGSVASVVWTIDSSNVGTGVCTLTNATTLTTATITCTDNGAAVVKLTATDDDGATASATANVTINNVAPTGTFGSPSADINEGSTFGLSISAVTDPSSVDTTAGFNYSFDCGAGYGSYASTASATCTAVDGPGTLNVGAKVRDKNLGETEYTGSVDVLNVNPTVAKPAFTPATINCGQTSSLGGISFSDPGVNDADWSLNIDWGDGSTDYDDTAVGSQGSYPSQSHAYTVPAAYTATVSVTDKDGGSGSNTAGITVNQTYSVNFLQPLDGATPSYLIANSMKLGRVVPVKINVKDDCTGAWVTGGTGETVQIKVTTAAFQVSPGQVDAVETFSDAGASSGQTIDFRWNADASAPGGGFWIYNLDSGGKGWGFTIGSHSYQVRAVVDGVTVNTTYAVLKPSK